MQSPSNLLHELLEQHAVIRSFIKRCQELLEREESGDLQVQELVQAVSKLRWAVESHNRVEEQLLTPVLQETDAFGEQRVAQMVAEHKEEHARIGERLESPVADSLRRTLAELLEHLEAEERYFLTSRVLRDDLVTVEGGG
ncbi:MAG: hemerythrin domain-containing protein [Kofleriaceae bacterium]